MSGAAMDLELIRNAELREAFNEFDKEPKFSF